MHVTKLNLVVTIWLNQVVFLAEYNTCLEIKSALYNVDTLETYFKFDVF